jgi:hypothetical protein
VAACQKFAKKNFADVADSEEFLSLPANEVQPIFDPVFRSFVYRQVILCAGYLAE